MMKKFATIIISTVLFILTFSVILNGQVSISNYLTFIQGDSIFRIDSSIDSLMLEKKPFAIRYFCKQYDEEGGQFYAAQIAVLKDPGNMVCLAAGKNTKSIPYFALGTGLASDASGMYESVFITEDGHHYLFYENENERKRRVNLISKNAEMLELEWTINSFNLDGKDYHVSGLAIRDLYFAVLIDINLNGIIDNNELKCIKISFR